MKGRKSQTLLGKCAVDSELKSFIFGARPSNSVVARDMLVLSASHPCRDVFARVRVSKSWHIRSDGSYCLPFEASPGETEKMENWFKDPDNTCRVDLEPNWIVLGWLKDGIRRFCESAERFRILSSRIRSLSRMSFN